MDHLLDTCALILFLEDNPLLPKLTAELIENPSARSFVSTASLWEISLKHSVGKLTFSHADNPRLPEILHSNGFEIVQLEWETMRRSCYLPYHHRDPFDRLLVVEAQRRNLPIISSDRIFDNYGLTRYWK